jgi:peptide/nickel transport system substrate-binding protein
MMTRHQWLIGALVIVLVAAAEPARGENILRWASATEALTFDPHAAAHVPTQVENSQIYEPLVDFSSSYKIEPALAVA